MARRPMKPIPEPPKSAPRRKQIPGLNVEAVPVPARRLEIFDETHPIWTGRRCALSGLEGAIVRLRPPPGSPTDLVEGVKKTLTDAGVARIKLEERRGVVIPREAVEKSKATKSSAREVVLQLVAESNTMDRESLAEIVERTMAEQNL